MTHKPILCVIPVHNGAHLIGRAIDSLMAQSAPPSRILVVDDGSADDLAGALRGYDGRVQRLDQVQSGPTVARNRGALTGDEPFISFLDADDEYEPERFERALAIMEDKPGTGAVVCMAQNFDAGGTPVGDPLPAYTAGALMVRRETFLHIGVFNDSLPHGSAMDWFLRAREAGMDVALDPTPLLKRHIQPGSFSETNAIDSHREHLAVVRAALQRRRS